MCEAIAGSHRGLKSICQQFGIGHTTFHYWIAADETLAAQYLLAREMQADYIAGQIIEIADDTSDLFITDGTTGVRILNPHWVKNKHLRIEARKWKAARLNPKKYNEKFMINPAPPIPEPIIIDLVGD